MTEPLTRERAEEIVAEYESFKIPSAHLTPTDYAEIRENYRFAIGFLKGHKAMREKARRLEEAAEKLYLAMEESRELLGVFEDNGGHDGLAGKAYALAIDHAEDARGFYREALADFRREAGE